jgi:cyclopropane-fatty-acyl-phospholipid synthase
MGESAPTRFKTGNESEESSLHRLLVELLEQADVRIGGDRPWDMRLIDPHVPERVFSLGSLGLGESYMDGHWEVEQLDQFFDKILRAHLDRKVRAAAPPRSVPCAAACSAGKA